MRLIRRTCETFGIFDRLYTDDGSAFAGHLVAGGAVHRFRNAGAKLAAVRPLGIRHHLRIDLKFALPKTAQAKIAERTFATLSRVIDDRPESAPRGRRRGRSRASPPRPTRRSVRRSPPFGTCRGTAAGGSPAWRRGAGGGEGGGPPFRRGCLATPTVGVGAAPAGRGELRRLPEVLRPGLRAPDAPLSAGPGDGLARERRRGRPRLRRLFAAGNPEGPTGAGGAAQGRPVERRAPKLDVRTDRAQDPAPRCARGRLAMTRSQADRPKGSRGPTGRPQRAAGQGGLAMPEAAGMAELTRQLAAASGARCRPTIPRPLRSSHPDRGFRLSSHDPGVQRLKPSETGSQSM